MKISYWFVSRADQAVRSRKKEEKKGMSEVQLGWKLVVRNPAGRVLKVHRRLPAQEARERARRAKNCGNEVEMSLSVDPEGRSDVALPV